MLVARKPCSFGGEKFYIGDIIPEKLVANPKAQEKMGNLSVIKSDEGTLMEGLSEFTAQVGEVLFEIPIVQKDGELKIMLSEEKIAKIFGIMQMTVKEAETAIENISDEDVLIVLNACDSRKTVKSVTEAVATRLNQMDMEGLAEEHPEESEEESAGDE